MWKVLVLYAGRLVRGVWLAPIACEVSQSSFKLPHIGLYSELSGTVCMAFYVLLGTGLLNEWWLRVGIRLVMTLSTRTSHCMFCFDVT